ncbi:hypothetical protein ACI2KH_06135 [Roseomonas mucosa]|uniref:hypothetical protein n=1 Tax=Roseomonas mucosa TaxID=207340 RepID=UPI003850D0F5
MTGPELVVILGRKRADMLDLAREFSTQRDDGQGILLVIFALGTVSGLDQALDALDVPRPVTPVATDPLPVTPSDDEPRERDEPEPEQDLAATKPEDDASEAASVAEVQQQEQAIPLVIEARPVPAPPPPAPAAAPETIAPRRARQPVHRSTKEEATYERQTRQVQSLAELGFSTTEIAQQTGMAWDEVEWILSPKSQGKRGEA